MAKQSKNPEESIEPEVLDGENIDIQNIENQEDTGESNRTGGDEVPLTEAEILRAELGRKTAELATLNDTWLRLAAEFENFRKRTLKEKSALLEYASEGVITALLPVLDDFDRSLTVIEKTDNLSSIREGIRLVRENLYRILHKEGLEPIESVGKEFDSSRHEAITSISAGEEKVGVVVDEAEKGYRLKDKVIRYAKVIVGE